MVCHTYAIAGVMSGASTKSTWISQRMPNELVEALRDRARREGVSVASLIIDAVRNELARIEIAEAVARDAQHSG